MDGPFAVEAQKAGVLAGPPVPVGVLVGRIRGVDGVDPRHPGRSHDLDSREVPEIPGIRAPGSKLPSTRARCEAERSPAPKMIASSRPLDRAISTAFSQALGLLDEDLEAYGLRESELAFDLGQEHVNPPNVAAGTGLRDDDDVERFPRPSRPR